MGILDVFDPKRDGWSFANWSETSEFSWDLYRRTYLAINPTNNVAESPLDVAFYEIFKNCAQHGNCGGMAMLGLALFKYGGYMGFCSPPNFYAAANTPGHKQPSRTDLYQAINIMQGRQFSAAGIRNFLDVVKAGQLNDGVAAWNRIQSGLASGDYCLLSLSNGIFGDAAHTIIPYRAEMEGGKHVLYVWDSVRPYAWYHEHYDAAHNRIVISSPTSWSYDQDAGGLYTGGHQFDGSNNGWFFAIPTSLEIHKGRQPISAGFVLTGVMTLFVSGTGAAVTQIEDDGGRRLFSSDHAAGDRRVLETSPRRRLAGVAPWPWPGGEGRPPGDLFFIDRPAGSSPLHVSVQGGEYHLMHLSSGHLTEVTAGPAGSTATDRLRLQGSPGDHQSVVLTSSAPGRSVTVHHLRDHGSSWRSATVNATIGIDPITTHAPVAFDSVTVSGTPSRKPVDVVLRHSDRAKVTTRALVAQRVPKAQTLRLAPADWTKLARTKIDGESS
jgi:hypothetical protein